MYMYLCLKFDVLMKCDGWTEDQKTDNQKIEIHRTNDKHFMLCNTHALLRTSFVSFGVFFGGVGGWGWVRECLS